MKGLYFFSRLAFICNLLFLVCVAIQHTHDFIARQELSGLIIILGWFTAPFLNLAVNIWQGVLLIKKRQAMLPVWLAVVNFSFLLLQFFIYFILPS